MHIIKKMFRLLFLILFLFPVYLSAQTDTVIKPRVYTNLERAMAEPEQVKILRLSKKRIKKFPEGILLLKNLEKLDLSGNKLKVIPPEIGTLTRLKEIDLSRNKIKKLPKETGNLTRLEKLSINRNPIDSLPDEISGLINLQVLDMWSTELAILPESIRKLENLKTVELRGILFNQEQQEYMRSLLPDATIHFSPPCNCKF
jgi:Leucine-rich repeat (LRR) protein